VWLVQGPLGACPGRLPHRRLTDALAAGGGEAKRAFVAMMPMKKIDSRPSRQHGGADVDARAGPSEQPELPPGHLQRLRPRA